MEKKIRKKKYDEAFQNIAELESVRDMEIWCRYGYETVYRHTRKTPFDGNVLTLPTGRSMTVTAQILLRHKNFDFNVSGVTAEGIRDGISVTFYRQEYDLFNDGIAYPDRLSDDCTCHGMRFATQGYLVVFHTDKDVGEGLYPITVRFETDFGEQSAQINLRVYPVTVPDPADSVGLHEYYFQYWKTERVGGMEKYSDAWWGLMKNYAESMKGMRINSLYLTPDILMLDAGSRRISATVWHFEFSLLDRMIDVFFENGSFRTLALAAMTDSFSARYCDAPGEQGKDGPTVHLDLNTEEGECYYRALYTALYRHFAERGMLDRVYVHVCDEIRNPDGWLRLCGIIRECWPDAITGEPMDDAEVSYAFADTVNIYMPRIDIYEDGKLFYDARKEMGDTVCCYSCCFPDDPRFLNKFSNQPCSYSEMMHWAIAANHLDGFMHWGFNHWDPNYQYEGHPYKGDAYIVYPSSDGRVLPSSRYFETVAGIEMYELLKQAEKLNPGYAHALACSVADTFHTYREENIGPARTALLEFLTSAEILKNPD